jgi:glyoxylase-like metal-dependent hydrolase (beta-lactamase superfamily II)
VIELVTTEGIFSLDGEDFEVENNIWLVGDEREVIVVDAAHDAAPIAEAVGDRRVVCIACTHGHNDHINAAADLAERVKAPILIHPDDRMLWDAVYADRTPDGELLERRVLRAGPVRLRVLHTPGHSPGGVSLYDGAGHLFGGDTLFQGGPGATGRSFSDRATLVRTIKEKLFALPPSTIVHTGHGPTTTIAEEAARGID